MNNFRKHEAALKTIRKGTFGNGSTFEITQAYACFWVEIDGQEEFSITDPSTDEATIERNRAEMEESLKAIATQLGGIK